MKALYAKQLTEQEKRDFIKAFEQDLIDNPLYSKRIQVEPKPEFVPPPPCIPCTNDWGVITAKQAKFEVVPPYYARATLWFVVGILVGVLGCLYATSHIS